MPKSDDGFSNAGNVSPPLVRAAVNSFSLVSKPSLSMTFVVLTDVLVTSLSASLSGTGCSAAFERTENEPISIWPALVEPSSMPLTRLTSMITRSITWSAFESGPLATLSASLKASYQVGAFLPASLAASATPGMGFWIASIGFSRGPVYLRRVFAAGLMTSLTRLPASTVTLLKSMLALVVGLPVPFQSMPASSTKFVPNVGSIPAAPEPRTVLMPSLSSVSALIEGVSRARPRSASGRRLSARVVEPGGDGDVGPRVAVVLDLDREEREVTREVGAGRLRQACLGGDRDLLAFGGDVEAQVAVDAEAQVELHAGLARELAVAGQAQAREADVEAAGAAVLGVLEHEVDLEALDPGDRLRAGAGGHRGGAGLGAAGEGDGRWGRAEPVDAGEDLLGLGLDRAGRAGGGHGVGEVVDLREDRRVELVQHVGAGGHVGADQRDLGAGRQALEAVADLVGQRADAVHQERELDRLALELGLDLGAVGVPAAGGQQVRRREHDRPEVGAAGVDGQHGACVDRALDALAGRLECVVGLVHVRHAGLRQQRREERVERGRA